MQSEAADFPPVLPPGELDETSSVDSIAYSAII